MSVRREREKYVRQKDTTTKAQRARSRATGPIHRPEQKGRARRAAARHRARARACNLQNISRVNKAQVLATRYTVYCLQSAMPKMFTTAGRGAGDARGVCVSVSFSLFVLFSSFYIFARSTRQCYIIIRLPCKQQKPPPPLPYMRTYIVTQTSHATPRTPCEAQRPSRGACSFAFESVPIADKPRAAQLAGCQQQHPSEAQCAEARSRSNEAGSHECKA